MGRTGVRGWNRRLTRGRDRTKTEKTHAKTQREGRIAANERKETAERLNRRWTQIYADLALGSGHRADP
jgi:hypothetical protein